MSIKMMNFAWKMPLNSTETIVLLAIADAANDEGFGFPGYESLLEKTKLSRSTLAKTLDILEKAGFFERKAHAEIGKGRKSNTYQLLFDDGWFEIIKQPPPKSPRIELIESMRLELIGKINVLRVDKKRPISSSLELRKVHSSNPKSSRIEHEPSYNRHKEPSLKDIEKTDKQSKPKKQEISKKQDELELLRTYGISGDLATDFIAHRKTKKASISKTVIEGFKREASKAGIALEDAIRISIERGWQGFKSNWDWKESAGTRRTSENFAEQRSKEMRNAIYSTDF
jgi:hypothetical protein